jgi:hypothetical protein
LRPHGAASRALDVDEQLTTSVRTFGSVRAPRRDGEVRLGQQVEVVDLVDAGREGESTSRLRAARWPG